MDYDQQIQAAMLRQRDASGRSQYQNPEGRMVSGRYVAPNFLEYLSAGLRSAGAGREAQMAGDEAKDLGTQKQKAMQGDMSAMLAALRGKPAETVQPLTPNDDEGNVNPPIQIPAKAGGLDEFYRVAAGSQFPQFQQMGTQGMVQIPQLQAAQQEREDNRTFRQQEAQAARDARAAELKMRMEDQRASQAERLAAQKELREMQIQAQKETRQIIAASRPTPQVQTMQTENGMLERVNGQWQPVTIGGKPVMPKGAGAGAGNATEGERKAATLLQRMQGSEAQLEAALKLDKTAAKPGLVSSGLRSLGMDTVANTVTPENRQKVEAAQLDILDAALTLGTGAAYTKEQLEGYRKSYFPQLGDKPETVRDKQERLNNVLGAARIAAGRAGGQVSAPAAQAFPDANAIAAEIARRKGGK